MDSQSEAALVVVLVIFLLILSHGAAGMIGYYIKGRMQAAKAEAELKALDADVRAGKIETDNKWAKKMAEDVLARMKE